LINCVGCESGLREELPTIREGARTKNKGKEKYVEHSWTWSWKTAGMHSFAIGLKRNPL
jgi:hypothetical protein